MEAFSDHREPKGMALASKKDVSRDEEAVDAAKKKGHEYMHGNQVLFGASSWASACYQHESI